MALNENLAGRFYVTPGTFGEKGGKGGGTAKSAPDTIRSESVARVLDLISSGQIAGWDDVDPLKCVYFDDIPVRNANGSDNHKGIELNFRLGTPDQDYIDGFDFAANFESVGTEITTAVWPIYTVTDPEVDAVKLAIRIPALTITDSKTGALKGNTVRVGFDYKAAGDPSWTTWVDDTITEKFTAPQEYVYKRTLHGLGAFPILIRGHRYTADSVEVTDQKDTYFYGVTELIEDKFSYPGFALSALKAYAKQFGDRIPDRKFRVKGVLCLVPSNYDPVARTYADPWDGTFEIAWTNNPAWILYSVLVNKDWGLGRRIKPEMVDKWALYDIAKRCDELVDDGFGGQEPRYTFSAYVQSRQEASKALQSIAATFNGMIYAATSKVLFSQDRPKSVSRLIANANVIGGKFIYEGFGRSTKSSVAVVSWNDPEQLGKVVTEVMTNPAMRRRIGWKPKEVIAWGCTSRGQARRMGRWQLFSEQYENRAVSFRASLEMADLLPGAVVKIADQHRQGVRYGGRIVAINSSTVTMDQPLVITPDDVSNGVVFKIWVTRPDGTLVEKTVSNGAGTHTTLSFSTSLTGVLPQLLTTFILSSSAFDPPEYTVVSTKEVNSKEPYVEIVALRYFSEKFPSIEENYDFEPTSETMFSSRAPITAASDLLVEKTLFNTATVGIEQVTLTFTRSTNTFVTSYDIVHRFAGGEWQRGNTRTNVFSTQFMGQGTYEFIVIPKDFRDREGVQAYISETLADTRGFDRPTTTGLSIVNGSGGNFYGRDLKVAWALTPPVGITDPAYYDPYFLDYEVQILTTGNVLKGTYYTTDRFFKYSAEQNAEDNAGTPLPSFKVRVRMRDTLSTEGVGDWITITVTNPRPPTPTGIVITSDLDGILVRWDPSVDTDYSGTVVWLGTTNSFTLNSGSEKFRGPAGGARLRVTATGNYYVVVGHYDEFSATPTNVSGYTLVNVPNLVADVLDDDILTEAEKILLVPQLKELIASQSLLGTRATALNITTEKTNFDNAMTTLNNQLATLTTPVAWDNYTGVTGPTGLVGPTLASNFRDALEKRAVLNRKIDEQNANATVPASSANSVWFSQFEQELVGWGVYDGFGLAKTTIFLTGSQKKCLRVNVTFGASSQYISIGQDVIGSTAFARSVDVVPGSRIFVAFTAEVGILSGTPGLAGNAQMQWWDASGNFLSATNFGAYSGQVGFGTRIKTFLTVPANAVKGALFFYMGNSGVAGQAWMLLSEPMITQAHALQTFEPAFVPGPTADARLLPIGVNRVYNSRMDPDTTGYGAGWDGTVALPVTRGRNLTGSPNRFGTRNVMWVAVAGTPANDTITECDTNVGPSSAIANLRRYGVKVDAGDRIYVSSLFAFVGFKNCCLAVTYGDSTGAYVSEIAPPGALTSPGDGSNGVAMSRFGGFLTVPANVHYMWIRARFTANGSSLNPTGFWSEPYIAVVPASQITPPAFTHGELSRGAIVDALGGTEQLANNRLSTSDTNRVGFSKFEAGVVGWGPIEAPSGGIVINSTSVVTTNGRKGLQVNFTASGAGTLRFGQVSPYLATVSNSERVYVSMVSASATGVASVVACATRTYNDAGTILNTIALNSIAGGFTGQKWGLFLNVDATAVRNSVFIRIDTTGAGAGSFIIYEPIITGAMVDQTTAPGWTPSPNAQGDVLSQVVTRINKASEVGAPNSSIFTGSDPDTWVLLCDIDIVATGGHDIDVDCLTDLLLEQIFDTTADIQKVSGAPKFRLKVERSGVGAIYTSPSYNLSSIGQLPAAIFPVRDVNVPAGNTTYSLYAQWSKGSYTAGTVTKLGSDYLITGTGTSWLANAGQTQLTYSANQRAYGFINFAGQPANGNTITFNGTVWTFTSGAPSGNQSQIGGSLAVTISNLATRLNASVDANTAVATYIASASQLQINHDTPGTGGNSYALSRVGANITVPATLTNGASFLHPWEIRIPSVSPNWWPINVITSRSALTFAMDALGGDLYAASAAGAAYEIRANAHAVIMRLTGYTMRTTEYKNTAVI